MKIAITGTHGPAKTDRLMEAALRLRLAHPDHNVGIIQQIAPACPAPINRGVTLESQIWIAANQIKAEIELNLRHPHVVTDRCVIDP